MVALSKHFTFIRATDETICVNVTQMGSRFATQHNKFALVSVWAPGFRLNSSFIQWLFADQCEMPALWRGVTGKKQTPLCGSWSECVAPIVPAWPSGPSESLLHCFVSSRMNTSFSQVGARSRLWKAASHRLAVQILKKNACDLTLGFALEIPPFVRSAHFERESPVLPLSHTMIEITVLVDSHSDDILIESLCHQSSSEGSRIYCIELTSQLTLMGSAIQL